MFELSASQIESAQHTPGSTYQWFSSGKNRSTDISIRDSIFHQETIKYNPEQTKFDLVSIMLPLWTISNLQINQVLLSAILFKARVNGWRAMPPPNYKEISGATQWLPSWTELEQATHSWVYVNEARQHKISQISKSGRVRNLKAHASLLLFEICDKRI